MLAARGQDVPRCTVLLAANETATGAQWQRLTQLQPPPSGHAATTVDRHRPPGGRAGAAPTPASRRAPTGGGASRLDPCPRRRAGATPTELICRRRRELDGVEISRREQRHQRSGTCEQQGAGPGLTDCPGLFLFLKRTEARSAATSPGSRMCQMARATHTTTRASWRRFSVRAGKRLVYLTSSLLSRIESRPVAHQSSYNRVKQNPCRAICILIHQHAPVDLTPQGDGIIRRTNKERA